MTAVFLFQISKRGKLPLHRLVNNARNKITVLSFDEFCPSVQWKVTLRTCKVRELEINFEIAQKMRPKRIATITASDALHLMSYDLNIGMKLKI